MINLYSLILQSAALLVPQGLREDWSAEWSSELWYVLRECRGHRALTFCLGAFQDALWIRRHQDSQIRRETNRFQSPLACLLLLSAMAVVAVAFFLRAAGPLDVLLRASRHGRPLVFPHLFVIGTALLVMSGITSFSLGEYPATRSSPSHARRFLRWTFLALKFALLIPIVFCGTCDVAPFLGDPGLQPHAALVGYVIAFRWTLIDQRRRCPVCLHLLRESARIGTFSHNFLEWYGSELFCAKGHGLLHVPAIATTYDTQRWVDLDCSWSFLFF